MKKYITQLVGLTLGLLLVHSGSAQLSASTSTDANELLDIILSENSNLTYSNAILTGADGAAGIYEGADFDVANGVILSTGEVVEAAGPNTNLGNSTNFGTDGDLDLDELSGESTFDAVSLSADFVPNGSSLSFSYSLASEDYPAYVCSPFSDVMGIFISGGEYDNQNIALVPETDLIINSNTINDGNEGGVWEEDGCPEGGLDNSAFYIDNDEGLNHEYNGRTLFFNADLTVTPGETYNIKWALADGFDAIFDSALFLEAGSLSSSEEDVCTADGGELSIDGPTMVCKSDGEDDIFDLTLEEAEGENQTFLVTWANGNIFLITDETQFNLEGFPGNGTCLFWSISWDGEIEGLEVGENASDITGDCFDLSNSVEVTEYFTQGGTISTDDPTTICALDGEGDPIDVTLVGDAGMNSAWVITDAELNILGLPPGPPFDLEEAGEGVCLIWHLSWSGELTGAEMGANAGDLTGDCFDLSNSIEVTRYVAEGGEISTDDPTTICALDGEGDPIDVTLEGETGENSAWVITDAELNILGLPPGPPFDLEEAGEGVCLIWHLSWSGELTGAEIGANAGDLTGDCFDLSNSIEVTRYVAEGGEISTDDPTTICALDGEGDPIDVSLEGETGENSAWIITDAELNILGLPPGPPFDLEGAGEGVCLIWHLSWSGELTGAEMGANAGDLTGDCFDLSNSIEVTRYVAEGGEISTDDPTTICVGDGIPDPIDVALEGETGENSAWVITDSELNILGLPSGPPFDLEGAGEGVCLIWHLSWSGELTGAEMGANAGDLTGDCFDLSNSIEVIRETCGSPAEISILTLECGGEVLQVTNAFEGETNGGQATAETRTIYTFQPDDAGGIPNYTGVNWPYILVPNGFEAEEGVEAEITVGADNVLLFNGWPVYQFINDESESDVNGTFGPWSYLLPDGTLSQDACPDCTAEGGELIVDGPTMVCKSDGEDDIFDLTLEGAEGENQTFLVTWADGEIFLITDQTQFNLEGFAGNGICLLRSISWDGEIEGLELGENASDITGDCFDLSNSFEVTEYFTQGGTISTDDPTTICVGDGVGDPIDVTLDGDAGMNSAWVITDADLNILGLPPGPPFDLEGAGVGVCLIWNLSWSGDLEGAEVGANAGDLSGDCFDLSNSIEVVREDCGSNGGSVDIGGAVDFLTALPNPTDGITQIVFESDKTERISVEVIDMSGRPVEVLYNQEAQSGQEYRLQFEGSRLPNGVYLIKMTNGTEIEFRKLLIAR